MTSQARKVANEKNAQKSTGAKTAVGKRRSSKNAITHGMLSRDMVLPDEDPEIFEALRNEWFVYKQPVGPEEKALVETIVKALWRLRRHLKLESAILTFSIEDVRGHFEKPGSYLSTFGDEFDPLTDLSEEQIPLFMLGKGLLSGRTGPLLDTLPRYERANERRLYEALERLERLQKARKEAERSANILDVDGD